MCKICELKPVYEFTNKRKLCKSCFIKYFQKKVLYIIRKFSMIKSGDVIGYETGKDFRSVVLKDVMEMFAEKSPIQLVKLPSKKKNLKIAINFNIDLEAEKIINALIYEKSSKLKEFFPVVKKGNKIIIKPLYLFLDKEILLYAKLKNLKFIKIKDNKSKLVKFINNLEQNHPEVKRAVVNSYLKLMR